MKTLVLDLESTSSLIQKVDGKVESDIASPFNPDNKCVLVGTFDFDEYKSYDLTKPYGLERLKNAIKYTDVLIGHNIKYDVLWLKALGIDTSHLKYRDTMLREYLIYQGSHPSLGLSDVAPRYGGRAKMDFMKRCFDKDITVAEVPKFILAQYLYEDVMNTAMVYKGQLAVKELREQYLYDTFYHDVLEAVIEMEWNGAKFNDKIKDEVASDIDEMLFTSITNLEEKASKYVDKATFNPNSSVQLSRILFGLKFRPDTVDAEKPTHENSKREWKAFVNRFKPWEQGSQNRLEYAITKCFEQDEQSLSIKPNVAWITDKKFLTDSGISTGSKVIDSMLFSGVLTKKQEEFVTAVQAYSKASTWKTSNLFGVLNGVKPDGFIHGQLNMSVTSTRRFSASNPNMQNWPREGTNPIKKLITSRYDGGEIVCSDYAQLEFRIAGLLSGDTQLIHDVANDFDIHSHTATMAFKDKFTNAEGKERKELRTKAKVKTFEFQYGATPKTKIDQAIFDAFYGKYFMVSAWQEKTKCLIARDQRYVCPFTGVVFNFAGANLHNEFSWGTKAKNYPVQFLADCINKCAIVGIYNRIKGRDDIKLILTVHDSNVLDAAPEAIDEAKQILKEEMEHVTRTFEKYFNKTLDVMLAADVSSGSTWYEQN